MFENLVRSYVVIGLTLFGLRAVLYDFGLAPWVVVLSMAAALAVVYSVPHTSRVLIRIRDRLTLQGSRHSEA